MNVFTELWKRPIDQEKAIINNLLEAGELSCTGTGIAATFEQLFGEYIGAKYCLSFSHGTAAIMSAYFAAGIGPGDEVITPAIGYIASYSGAMHMGARPVFCDISADTLLIDPVSVRKKITKKTKAINIIHLNGRVCDMDAFLDISREYGIPLISDASHAHGAEWDGVKLGNFDHVTCFSLQGVNPKGKPVSGGEGGVACTNDKAAYQRMLAYCHLHRSKIMAELSDGPYADLDPEVLGLKWRSHPLALAVAFVSLGTLDERNSKLSESYEKTVNILKQFDFISVPKMPSKAKMGGFYAGFHFIYHPEKLRDLPCSEMVKRLNDAGIPALGPNIGYSEYKRTLFTKGFDLWGRHRGPIEGDWEGLGPFKPCLPSDFPVSESLQGKVFKLPGYIDVDPLYYTRLEEVLRSL